MTSSPHPEKSERKPKSLEDLFRQAVWQTNKGKGKNQRLKVPPRKN